MAKSEIAKKIPFGFGFFCNLPLEKFCDLDTFWQYISPSFKKNLSAMHVLSCQAHGSVVLAGITGTYTCSTGIEIIKQYGIRVKAKMYKWMKGI